VGEEGRGLGDVKGDALRLGRRVVTEATDLSVKTTTTVHLQSSDKHSLSSDERKLESDYLEIWE